MATLGFMKSGRQRRAEIDLKRAKSREKVASRSRQEALRNNVMVNPALLRPTNSYSIPDFVERGYYVDRSFRCKDCGKAEVWSPTQQKWWYESAKGDVWTTAVRCRPCRRRERERVAAARVVSTAGLAR
jgi:hypothetical protein